MDTENALLFSSLLTRPTQMYMYTFFFSVIGFKLHVAMIYEMVKLQLVRRKQLSFRELNTTPLLKKGIAKIFSMTFPAITECLLNLW